jgi:RimJ/RimL family protein N-acetyltransferase
MPGNLWTIRGATAADVFAVANFQRNEEYNRWIKRDSDLFNKLDGETALKIREHEEMRGLFYVATYNDIPFAYSAILLSRDKTTGYLEFGVCTTMQGKGVATDLVTIIIKTAATAFPLKSLRASCYFGNVASRMLLIKVGFKFPLSRSVQDDTICEGVYKIG